MNEEIEIVSLFSLMKQWEEEKHTKIRNGDFEYFEKWPIGIFDDVSELKLSYKDIFEKKAREYMAAYKIQQWWFERKLSPKYKIGRKFINKMYEDCFE